MVDCAFELFTDKNINPNELLDLMVSVGWGKESDYDVNILTRSISAYPIIAYCRDVNGTLVGYVSAFTDNAFSTFIGELIVRPEFQRKGIGSSLLTYVIEKCKGVPVYAAPFEDTQDFFLERGFKVPKRLMSVVSMRNAA
ncbi:GNAT family N-acetyltransferase [Methyloglobulus sp.]|uniref:GNAT family N-acetyltransferase n=1 Tax=Methyloglobulus sp. TaxID=2518622 RepID=UPI0032B74696